MLLTLRDEYPLLLRDEASRSVAGRALLFDEWLVRELAVAGAPEIFSDDQRGSLLVHAHCHQKALAGFGQTLAVLRSAGYAAEVIDSGCCGMAGSFGFEAEHYEMSQAMGELRAVPGDSRGRETPVAITGCRVGSRSGTSRRRVRGMWWSGWRRGWGRGTWGKGTGLRFPLGEGGRITFPTQGTGLRSPLNVGNVVPRGRIELPTPRFSVVCSTD